MPWKTDDSGNVVSDGGKPIFVHADGKEVPFDGDQTLGTIGRLNGEAKAHRERAEKLESMYKPFDGLDADAARKALETVSNFDQKKWVDAGEVEKVKSEAIKAIESQYAPYKTKAEELEGKLNARMVGDAFSRSAYIAKNFAAEGPAGVEIAQALFGSRLKVEGDKVVGYDLQGNKIYSPTRHGELADAEEAIAIMVESYAHKDHILKGSGASGGGASGGKGGTSGGKTMSRAQFDALSPMEKATAGRAAAKGEIKITD